MLARIRTRHGLACASRLITEGAIVEAGSSPEFVASVGLRS